LKLRPASQPRMVGPPPVYSPAGSVILGRTREIVWVCPIKLEESAASLPTIGARHVESAPALTNTIQAITPPPTKLFVRSSVHGRLTLDGLDAPSTVGSLKTQIRDRLRLPPTRALHLSTWGSQLGDDYMTLQEYKLRTGSQLDMRTSHVCPSDDRPLERLRVCSTALVTRTIAVSKHTTVLELKQKLHEQLLCGEHEWFDKQGVRTTQTGCTLLATANASADAKAETAAMRLGDEFVSTTTHLGEMGKGKPISVIRARRGGLPINIADDKLVALQLPPEKQTLTFEGRAAPDAALLYALGCRSDDTLWLEFESPAMPPVLALLRGPDKVKGGKKGKGKGGGGKGKGKKKK